MVLQAVLFDLDDTLTDRKQSLDVYAVQFAADFGDRLDAIARADLHASLVAADGGGYTPKDVLAASLIDRLPWRDPPEPAVLRSHWSAQFPRCAQPADGLERVIETMAARHLRIGVVTNGSSRSQRAKIDRLGIGPRLDVLVVSEEVGVKKPDGRIFERALNGLGVSAESVCFVGDHPVNDVGGAMAAGLSAVWISHGRDWPTDLPPPHRCIEHLAQLRTALPSP